MHRAVSDLLPSFRTAIRPSVVAHIENYVVIDVRHADAARIKLGLEEPDMWDERLFARG